MNKWRFAFQKRWFGYLAVVIVFAIVCVLLSNWQLNRRGEREGEIERVERNYSATPLVLEAALPTLESFDIEQRWLPVVMQGRYLPEKELLVRNRPYKGQPGYEVLTPLQLANGDIFVVDRGWIPTGQNPDFPDHVPAAPTGEVTVTARLKPSEDTIRGRGAGEGQLATIRLEEAAEIFGSPTYTGAYGLLDSEIPAPSEEPPAAAERPEPDEGPHLSYAFQWLIFGLMAFLFLGWAVREEYRRVNSDDPEERVRAEARAAKKARKITDSDIEDDLLDRE